MTPRLRRACLAAGLAAIPGRAVAAQLGRVTADGSADGYEDCTHGGHIALGVRLTDAATGRGVPWRVVFLTRVAWRAGRSAGTTAPTPNFGPERGIPDTGTADGVVAPVVWGRPGTYALTVTVPGYEPWHAHSVVVPQGAGHCDVGPEVVADARLRPVRAPRRSVRRGGARGAA